MRQLTELRAESAAQTANCAQKAATQSGTRLSRFTLLALATTALTLPAAIAQAAPVVLAGDYIKIGVNDAGTVGSGGSVSPGILYDGTGTGTFNTAYDYLTPGTPFEGFTVSGTAASPFVFGNNNSSGNAAGAMTGVLTDYSGVADGGETFDHRALWEGTATGVFTISHDYRFDDGGQQLMVVTTITALADLTDLAFARFTDPDAVAASGDSSSTNNFIGATGVSTDDLVYAEAQVSKYVIGLYSNSTTAHKAAVTGWSTGTADYLAGLNVGDGDNTIGLGFDIGSLLNGQSLVLNYSYIFGTNIANAISDAGAGGGTPTPAPGPTAIDAGDPSTVEDLLSGKVTPVFNGGVLTLASGGEVDKDFTVKAAGGGVDTSGHDLALTGALSGPGVLQKTGKGVLILTGANTHGGFDVQEGALAINSDGALGSKDHAISLSNDGTIKALNDLTLDHRLTIAAGDTGVLDSGAHSLQVAGDIGGGGSLKKTGSGTLTLSGANSFQVLDILEGEVKIGSQAALGDANGKIILNAESKFTAGQDLLITQSVEVTGDNARFDTGGADVVMTGSLSGKACFIKAGAGSLNLLAAASNDIGACVESGKLSFNNLFVGKVFVEAQGVAGGSGRINGDVVSEGVLAPGNSPGQLVVAGSVTQAATATLALDIDGPTAGIGAGHYDTLVLTGAGAVFTAGGTIAPILRGITGDATNSYVPQIGDTFQVVSAEGAVTGSFATVAQPADGLPANTRFDVVYMPRTVVLAVTPKSYAALALGTTNARTLAGVADAVRPAAGGRGENGFTAGLTGLKPLQLAAVLQQASGEAHADSLEGQLQGQRAARGQIAARLADGQASAHRVWGEYAADSFRLDGDADAAGFDADRDGMIFGVDGQVSPTLRVGAAFSYGETRLDAADLGSSRTESYQGHVYAAWRSGPYYVNGLVSAGTDQYKTSRRVDLSTGARAYAGRADGSSLAGDVEAGRDFAVGPARLTLAAGLAGDRVKRDALTEGGDAAAALSFGGATRQALQGRLGGRIAATTSIGPMKVTPRAALFVAQEFDDTATRLDASLQGRGFAVTTAGMGRTAVSLAAGADASVTDRLRVGLGYQYGWSQGGEAHAVRVRAALTW